MVSLVEAKAVKRGKKMGMRRRRRKSYTILYWHFSRLAVPQMRQVGKQEEEQEQEQEQEKEQEQEQEQEVMPKEENSLPPMTGNLMPRMPRMTVAPHRMGVGPRAPRESHQARRQWSLPVPQGARGMAATCYHRLGDCEGVTLPRAPGWEDVGPRTSLLLVSKT